MSKPNPPIPDPPAADGPDTFGAHVGLTLEDLHRLRYVRWRLEMEWGKSVTLTDALAWVISYSACWAIITQQYNPQPGEPARPPLLEPR